LVTAVFVDTSAFFAVTDGGDRHHRAALSALKATLASGRVVTSDHVLVESWLLVSSRLGREAAMRFWDGLSIDLYTIVNVTADDRRRALEIARQWPDQTFSIVDCTSFALIERLEIRCAFAFDRHFRIIRFGRRRRALEIVPH
jgi:predicted nucleic acid-binding protein